MGMNKMMTSLLSRLVQKVTPPLNLEKGSISFGWLTGSLCGFEVLVAGMLCQLVNGHCHLYNINQEGMDCHSVGLPDQFFPQPVRFTEHVNVLFTAEHHEKLVHWGENVSYCRTVKTDRFCIRVQSLLCCTRLPLIRTPQ